MLLAETDHKNCHSSTETLHSSSNLITICSTTTKTQKDKFIDGYVLDNYYIMQKSVKILEENGSSLKPYEITK